MWTDNETDLDLLGFRVHAELVRAVVVDPKLLPVTIGVFADWGGGKTSLMKMLETSLDPESWPKDSPERLRTDKIACLYFNGWLFEGYDDAKSAILSSVLLALGEHTRLGPKVRKRCVSLLKSVNWMRVASLGMKHVAIPAIAAYVSGGTSLVPAFAGALGSLVPSASPQQEGDKPTDAAKPTSDAESVDWESLIKADKTPAGPLDVRTFREQFGKMLKECDVDSLVVLIDDLDRCSPERIIENLEAIKLFLNVEHTAFVIGADPRIVRHAISLKYHKQEHFSEDAEAPTTVVTDYLEKLIQYPYRLPRLSPAEIETYMALLFCQHHLSNQHFLKTVEACDLHRHQNRYAVFGYAPVIETLRANGNPKLDDGFIQALTFCAEVSSLITEGLKGNPRQVKRFLNAFVLRKKLASVAKLTNIRDDVLVKLMILEYAHEKRFRELYDWQATEKGFPSQLAKMEEAIRAEQDAAETPKEIKGKSAIPDEWCSPQLRSWVAMKPPLAGVDLRDYFWVARDRLQSSMAGLSMVPPLVRRTFEGLLSGNVPQRNAAVKGAAELHEAEREQLFELLEQNIRQKPAEKPGYDAFRQLVDNGIANSAKRMANALLAVPESQVPAAAGTDLDTLTKAKSILKPIFDGVLRKWRDADDTRVGKALRMTPKAASKN